MLKSFDFSGKNGFDAPATKGSLSKFRARISHKFFRDLFFNLISRFESSRATFNGLRVYASDGFELILPRTKGLLKAGFRGHTLSDHREMYYPRMYLTHCYDVLTGVSKNFKHHHVLDEIGDAVEMVPELEENSLVLYDRLFLCERVIKAHKAANNFFLVRCKTNSFSEVQSFIESVNETDRAVIHGVTIQLIKIKIPDSDNLLYFATNLPKSWVTEEIIGHLYDLRWEVEVSFKDLLETMKIEQWHSKSLNGILQELYAGFWLLNYVKIQMAVENKKPLKVLESEYSKPNFKLIFNFIVGLMPKLFQRFQGVYKNFSFLMKLCTERRKRHSRSYKRELKTSASPYSYNNTVWVHDS